MTAQTDLWTLAVIVGLFAGHVALHWLNDRMQALAIDPLTSTPDELAAFIPAEIAKWAQVVKDAGIVPE